MKDVQEQEDIVELFPSEKPTTPEESRQAAKKKVTKKSKKSKSRKAEKPKSKEKKKNLERKQSWSLRKTLRRKPHMRSIKEDDLKYIWSAYQQGALTDLGAAFENTGLKPAEFNKVFIDHVHAQYSFVVGDDAISLAWSILANCKKKFIPVASVYGVFHPLSHVIIVAGISWYPWATARNKVEGTIKFFNKIRKDIKMIGYARPEQKALYEVAMKHGIMRRVGTSHTIFADVPATIYETI